MFVHVHVYLGYTCKMQLYWQQTQRLCSGCRERHPGLQVLPVNAHVYECVYVYVRARVCRFSSRALIYVYSAYIYIYSVYIYVHPMIGDIHTYTHTHKHTQNAYYRYIHTCIHSYMHTHPHHRYSAHKYTHTHTHKYTHTYTQKHAYSHTHKHKSQHVHRPWAAPKRHDYRLRRARGTTSPGSSVYVSMNMRVYIIVNNYRLRRARGITSPASRKFLSVNMHVCVLRITTAYSGARKTKPRVYLCTCMCCVWLAYVPCAWNHT